MKSLFQCSRHKFSSTIHDYCPFCKLQRQQIVIDAAITVNDRTLQVADGDAIQSGRDINHYLDSWEQELNEALEALTTPTP